MIVNVKMISDRIREYEKYFEDFITLDRLYPVIGVKITHHGRSFGSFRCTIDEYGEIYNYYIQISDYYDYTEENLRDIIVHEMIHFFIVYYKLAPISKPHGKVFKEMAKHMNEKYGMDIRKHPDLDKYKIREDLPWYKKVYYYF